MPKMTFTSDLALRRIAQIQHLLRREDLTSHELAEGIFVHIRTAQSYIEYLHSAGMIHIASYRAVMRERSGNIFAPVYCWRKAADAVKPKPVPKAEQKRRYYHDPEKIDMHRAKARARYWKPRRDWTAAWIPARGVAAA